MSHVSLPMALKDEATLRPEAGEEAKLGVDCDLKASEGRILQKISLVSKEDRGLWRFDGQNLVSGRPAGSGRGREREG